MSGVKLISLIPNSNPAPASAPAPAQQSAPSSAQSIPSTGKPPSSSGQSFSAKRQVSQEEEFLVSSMQGMVNGLIKGLTEGISSLPEDKKSAVLSSIAPGDIIKEDGKWGPGTKAAIDKINSILSKIGQDVISAGSDYSSTDPKIVMDAAKGNIDKLYRVMKSFSLDSYIPSSVPARHYEYDIVGKKLNASNVKDNFADGIVVAPHNLDNMWTFYEFVKDNFTTLSAEAAAKLILERTIIKSAQDVSPNYQVISDSEADDVSIALQEKRNKEFESLLQENMGEDSETLSDNTRKALSTGEITVEFFDHMIDWFLARANFVYSVVRDGIKNGLMVRRDGKIIPEYTNEDLKNAKAYADAMYKIAVDWEINKKRIIGDNPDLIIRNRELGHLREFSNRDKLLQDNEDIRKKIEQKSRAYKGREQEGGAISNQGPRGERQQSNTPNSSHLSSPSVIRELAEKYNISEKEAQDIVESYLAHKSGNRAGQPYRNRNRGQDYSDREGFSIVRSFPNGPISDTISLDRLSSFISDHDAIDWVYRNVGNKIASKRTLSTIPMRSLVDSFQSDSSNLTDTKFAAGYPYYLWKVLNSVFNTWRNEMLSIAEGQPPNIQRDIESKITSQYNWLNEWRGIASNLQANAMRWRPSSYTAVRDSPRRARY